MFALVQQFTTLSAGKHEWTEVGKNSGIFITVHSSPSDEAAVISKVDAFEKNLFGSDKHAAEASAAH